MCAFEVLTFYASLALVMFAIVLLGLVSSASSPEIKKGSPYSITERRVPELIPVLGSQPVGDVSHKPDGRLPSVFTRPAVTPATLKRVATNFNAW